MAPSLGMRPSPGARRALALVALLRAAPLAAAAAAAQAPEPTRAPCVAVIGATGKVGRHAVRQLADRGYAVRCLVRHQPAEEASAAKDASPAEVAAWLAALPGVELVRGDATDAGCVAGLLRGCSACFALHGATRRTRLSDFLPWVDETEEPGHAKRVNRDAVSHILEAARAGGTCRRVVRITGRAEAPWSPVAVLINLLGSMAKAWNYEGERLLRACPDIDYTIIRPGFMGDVDARLEDMDRSLVLGDNGADLKVSPIPHRSVAALCVQCLDYPNAARATLCAMTVPRGEGGEDSYAPLLAAVQPDSRAFPGGELFEAHQAAVRAGGLGLAALAAGALAGALPAIRGALGALGASAR